MGNERFTLRSAAYLILLKNSKILLLKRKNTGWMDGYYSLIAGHLEEGEKVAETMSREAEEEAGIRIEPSCLRVVHVMHRKSNVEYIDFFLTADSWEGEIVNREPYKCEELAWFSLNNLPKNTVPHVREAVRSYQNKTFFSENNWS